MFLWIPRMQFRQRCQNFSLKIRIFFKKVQKIPNFRIFPQKLVVCKTDYDAKKRGRTGSGKTNHNQNHKRHRTQGIII